MVGFENNRAPYRRNSYGRPSKTEATCVVNQDPPWVVVQVQEEELFLFALHCRCKAITSDRVFRARIIQIRIAPAIPTPANCSSFAARFIFVFLSFLPKY